jgi:hypothetical protein
MYKRKLRGAVLLAASREGDDFSSTDLAGGLHAVCQALEDQVDMDSLDKDGVQRLAVAAKVLSSIVMQRMEWTTTQAAYDAGGIIVKMPTRTHVKRKKFGTIVQVNVDVTARCRDFFERHGGLDRARHARARESPKAADEAGLRSMLRMATNCAVTGSASTTKNR